MITLLIKQEHKDIEFTAYSCSIDPLRFVIKMPPYRILEPFLIRMVKKGASGKYLYSWRHNARERSKKSRHLI